MAILSLPTAIAKDTFYAPNSEEDYYFTLYDEYVKNLNSNEPTVNSYIGQINKIKKKSLSLHI